MRYILILILLSSCLATQHSNKRNGEVLSLQTYQYQEPLTFQDASKGFDLDPTLSRGLITSDLLLKTVDFAFEGIKTAIKKGAEKYHQEYYLSLYNNSFYAHNSELGMLDPDQIRFRGFEINRTIALEDGRELALKACFSMDQEKLIDIYTQSKFYLRCDSLRIDYTKVKMNARKWYLPWTLFFKEQKEVNVDIDIDILANWIDGNGQIHKAQPYGKFHFPIRNYKVGSNDSSYTSIPLGGYCYLIPRSSTYCYISPEVSEPCFGQGDFDILVKVTESSKHKGINKLIYDNVGVLDDVDSAPIKDLIGS